MDSPTIVEPKRKMTSIPRLRKKTSYDSGVLTSNEYHQDETILNRSSSDPNCQQSRTLDQSFAINKTKNLYKFTINEHLLNAKNEESTNETDIEVASNMSGEQNCKSKHIIEEIVLEEGNVSNESSPRKDTEIYSTDDGDDGTTTNDEGSFTNRTVNEQNHSNSILIASTNEIPNSCCNFRNFEETRQTSLNTISNTYHQQPHIELKNTRHEVSEEELLRNRLMTRGSLDVINQNAPKQSLQEAYIKQRTVEKQNQIRPLNQCRWNIINPLYKNLELKRTIHRQNSGLTPRLISDINVSALVKDDDMSDIDDTGDIDDSSKIKNSPSLDETNCNLYKLYNLSKKKELIRPDKMQINSENKSEQFKRDSIVNAFLEVFGNDSHIMEKLRNTTSATKHDDRFRKIRNDYQRKDVKSSEVCVIQDSPRDTLEYESCKSKLVHDLYKSDDIVSTLTQSSNDRSIPDNMSCLGHSKQSKQKSGLSIKGCGCEIKHLQLNDVQKSIADIHSGMQMMLATFSSSRNGDVALELGKLRALYEECLLYQRKTAIQNQRLMNDIHHICCSVAKIVERQESGSQLKFWMLPLIGVVTYYVFVHLGLCKQISLNCKCE